MLDSYEKILAAQYATIFIFNYLFVTIVHIIVKRFSDNIIWWSSINVFGFIFVSTLNWNVIDLFKFISLGGINNGSVLVVSLLVFSTRFIARYLNNRIGVEAGKRRFSIVSVLPSLLTFSIGYGFVQFSTDKAGAQSRLSEVVLSSSLGRMLREDPELMPVFRAFQVHFPKEFRESIELFWKKIKRRMQEHPSTFEYRRNEAFELVKEFVSSQVYNISRSSDQNLVAIFKTSASLLEEVSIHPVLCAAAANGDRDALLRSNDPTLKEPSSSQSIAGLSRALVASIEAASDGKRRPRNRDFSKLPQNLVAAFSALPIEQQQILNGERAGTSLQTCQAAIGFNQAIAALPEADIAFWTALLYNQKASAQAVRASEQ
jgi:hypothetical protein